MINKNTYKREFSPIYKLAVSGVIKKEIEHGVKNKVTGELMSGSDYLKQRNAIGCRNPRYINGVLTFFDMNFCTGDFGQSVWLEVQLFKTTSVIRAICTKYRDNSTIWSPIVNDKMKINEAVISNFSCWYEDNKYEYNSVKDSIHSDIFVF